MRAVVTAIADVRVALAGACLVAAAMSLHMAWLHTRAVEAMGVICGRPADPHCVWCPLAALLLVASLILFDTGLRRRVRPG